MKTAVVVIDVQQGLCDGEEAAYASGDVIARINAVTAKARAAGAVVIFVQHESESGLLQLGTDPWQLAPGLEIGPGDIRLRKTTPDAFSHTVLKDILGRHGVSDLVICGMHTEFCVDTTTRRALALGYPVVLVADAHTTTDKAHLSAARIIAHHNETLAQISSFGPRARVVASAALQFKSRASASSAVALAPERSVSPPMQPEFKHDCRGVDWQAVATILKTVGMTHDEPDEHRRAFESSHTVVFAYHGGRLIGFGRAISDGVCQAAVYDCAVRPDVQGQGIGRLIMAHILGAHPDTHVILYASPGKEGFYRKLGFRKMLTGMASFRDSASMQARGFSD